MVSKKSTLSVIQKFSWEIGGFAENISNNVFITENTEYCYLENVLKK